MARVLSNPFELLSIVSVMKLYRKGCDFIIKDGHLQYIKLNKKELLSDGK